jgi:hypothetical protein
MTNPKARAELRRLIHNARVLLSWELPYGQPPQQSPEDWESYLRNNPDQASADIGSLVIEQNQNMAEAKGALDEDEVSTTALILSQRIKDLKAATKAMFGADKLEPVCFGTIPGGGLDAFSFKAKGADEYGIVIPDGLFNIANLFTKLVVLLQPFTQTPEGLVYLPSAGFAQFGLVEHPYVKFRHRDVVNAYLVWGDPEAALPYTQAVPFQDRFGYLLSGTELFVLAHEVAHIVLGHFDEQGATKSSVDRELEADGLAVQILTKYFAGYADVPTIRASLAAFMFLSLNRMWQRAVNLALQLDGKDITQSTHPGYQERFDHFVAWATALPPGKTPGWLGLVFNAIRLATETMSDAIVPDIIRRGAGTSALSARVLPARYAALGRRESPGTEQWSRSVAELILSNDKSDRRLGLWFLLDPDRFGLSFQLYEGLRSDDLAYQDLCRRALISIEPLYGNYIPRLMERFKESDADDELNEYILKISMFLRAAATSELGPKRVKGNPMDDGFFND